ncbi:MAG: hypothetical protein AAB516_01880 [Patescibacteria group bacterium]
MKALKIAAMILVISAGLLGSYWIIKDAKKADSETAGFSLEDAIKPGGTLFKYIEKAAQDIQGAVPNNNATSSINTDDSSNLTEMIAKVIANKVIEQNKNGLTKTETGEQKLAAPNQEVIIQELTRQLSNLDSNLLNPNQPINENDLNISQDNSQEAQIKYIEKISKIHQNYFWGFNKDFLAVLSDAFERNDTVPANQLANIYKNTSDDFLNLTVPSDWLEIHKRLISYFQTSEFVLRAVANYSNDPVKALMALDVIDHLLIDGKTNRELFNQKIKELEL